MAELCRRRVPCVRAVGVPFFFFFFFFFLSTLGRTNVFFVQEHILAKFGALRARSFNSRDRSLEGIDIVICMGVLACACERG